MSKLSALIVDDARFMRVTLSRVLRNYDVEIVGEAENGLKAVELYSILKPSIVIMDIAMPVMDGIEAIKKIIKHDAGANIIVCSTLADRQKVIEAIKEGAASYILKPPSEEKLINEINNIFGENTLVKNKNAENLEDIQVAKANVPAKTTDYELGYRAALVEVGKKLIKDKVDISKVCSYLGMDVEMLKEEKLIK